MPARAAPAAERAAGDMFHVKHAPSASPAQSLGEADSAGPLSGTRIPGQSGATSKTRLRYPWPHLLQRPLPLMPSNEHSVEEPLHDSCTRTLHHACATHLKPVQPTTGLTQCHIDDQDIGTPECCSATLGAGATPGGLWHILASRAFVRFSVTRQTVADFDLGGTPEPDARRIGGAAIRKP